MTNDPSPLQTTPPPTIAPWSADALPTAIARYLRAFQGEFDVREVASELPYCGPPSAQFRRSQHDGERIARFHRFATRRRTVFWEPRRHAILNPLTADLLAAAQALGGRLHARGSSAGPFGFHAGGCDVWVELLDGGVGVEVEITEHQTTNLVHAAQRTTILGAAAFRALTRTLGFEHVRRRLPGEAVRPDLATVDRNCNDLLAAHARAESPPSV
jgi:hypothetical protein